MNNLKSPFKISYHNFEIFNNSEPSSIEVYFNNRIVENNDDLL